MSTGHRLVVHGRDHQQLGAVVGDGVSGPNWSAGLAHSRGLRDKSVPSLSPNEDSAYIVTDAESFVWMGVADGHHGDFSSWHAVEHFADRPDLLERATDEVVDAVLEANLSLNADRPAEQPESRTTLVAARLDLADGTLRWMSMGDSTIGLQTPERSYERLNQHQHRFHGYAAETRESASRHWTFGTRHVRTGSVLVLASDGWTDYFPPGSTEAQTVQTATKQAINAEEIAENLVRGAFLGQAGDHVTSIAVAIDR